MKFPFVRRSRHEAILAGALRQKALLTQTTQQLREAEAQAREETIRAGRAERRIDELCARITRLENLLHDWRAVANLRKKPEMPDSVDALDLTTKQVLEAQL